MAIDADLAQQTAAMDDGFVGVMRGQLSTEDLEVVQAAIKAAEEQAKAERDQVLETLAGTISARRADAIKNRTACGIEDEWLEDEESYEGVDDANRAEEAVYRSKKPIAGTAVTIKKDPNEEPRSTVFMNITRPFVDAASARVSDMLQPTDDRAWQFKPTPLPDAPAEPLALAAPDAAAPQGFVQQGMEMPPPGQMPPQPGQPPQGAEQGGPPQQPPPAPPTAEELRAQEQIERRRKVERGQEQVDDWLIEANYHGAVRRCFDDSARIGTGILKGPFPDNRRRVKWQSGQMVEFYEIVPDCSHVDAWDFFPDWPACGENIHRGAFVFERERVSGRTLAELQKDPTYFKDQIALVLNEGPALYTNAGKIDPDPADTATGKGRPYESWIYYGFIDREDMAAIGVDVPEGESPQIPVLAVLVNDRIIKLAANPLDSGAFPYSVMPWTVRRSMPWGRGVARLVRTPQRQVNAATRNMMDNAGIAAGLILMLNRRGLTSADGNWTLHGRKMFFIDGAESATQTARDAIAAVEIPMRTKELMAIIDFALMMAERVTGMPLLLQGQQGAAPDTVGGMTMLSNNASTVMRRIAKAFDDNVTEPLVTRMYEWLQQYTDDPAMQFDAVIDARGSSALVERDMQNQWISQMGQFVLNPAFKINPAKWFGEFSKSVRFDPERIQYSDEEWKEIQAQQQPQPPPQVQAAQIREQGQTEREGMRQQAEAALEQSRQQAEAQRQAAELAAERERELMKLVGEENMTTREIKARLLELVTNDRRARDLQQAELVRKDRFGTGI